MDAAQWRILGPVPSRRLGHSLGINNVPHKACTYSCVYCQVGPTPGRKIRPQCFFEPRELIAQVRTRLEELEQAGQRVDYITVVPDGEPTLDENLDELLVGLCALAPSLAVITNGSLLSSASIRRALQLADWVSVKVDGVDAEVWHGVNRPHPLLRLETVLFGIRAFSEEFSGPLCTETMLVRGINDTELAVRDTATFIAQLDVQTAYLAIPTRPPAEPWVQPPTELAIVRAYDVFSRRLDRVELLSGFPELDFAAAGDIRRDIASTAAVHPIRSAELAKWLEDAGETWEVVTRLEQQGVLRQTAYGGEVFYVAHSQNMNASTLTPCQHSRVHPRGK